MLLATPWPATTAAVEGLGDLAGKVLIDATNPLLRDLSGVEYGTTTTVGFNIMANPAFGGDRPVMFYRGDDDAAKPTVRPLVEQLGFEAVDAGPLSQAHLLEPFALLWISLAYAQRQGREIGFKLLRR